MNGHFGHLGHSEVSENGHKEFPMPQYLGIDTKITFLAGSEPKLRVWSLRSAKAHVSRNFVAKSKKRRQLQNSP